MRSALITALLFVLAGCNSIGTWQDEKVPQNVQAEVEPLTDKLVEAIRSGNENGIRLLCSDPFLQQQGEVIKTLATDIPDRIRGFSFVIRHRFYSKDLANGKTHRFETGNGEHDFSIAYTPLSKESYAVVGEFQTPVEQYCALIVYGKYGSEWKINILYVGNRSMENKDVYDWYRLAEKHLENGNTADAALDVLIIRSLLKPTGDLWHYNAEDKIERLCKKIERTTSEQFAFPIACESVTGKPRIYSLNNQSFKEGIYPAIEYISEVDLRDSLAAEKESRAVHASIDRIFPGISRNNDRITYRAWEKSVLANTNGKESRYRGYSWDTH
jgi:hypothetical protein